MKFLTFLLLAFLWNCAIFQKKNLRLVYAVEENLVPENGTMKVVAAPIYLPLGIAGGILDVFLIHPLAMLPKAAKDTISTVWRHRESGYVTRMGAIPFLTLASPIYFSLSWIHYWLFKDYDYEYVEQPKPERKTPEEWVNLLGQKMQDLDSKEGINEFSRLMYDCSFYVDQVDLSGKFETILLYSEAETPLVEVTNCVYYTKNKWVIYEDLLIRALQKRDKNIELFVRPLVQKKSIKGSAAILEKMSGKKLSDQEFKALVFALFQINHPPHVQEFQARIQSQKK